MSTNYKDMINQMYDSQLESQKEQLKIDYETALSDMDARQAAEHKALDQKLRDTRVDSKRAAVSNAEYYAAAGLSSGARAQARLSQENQLLSDLTELRAAQQLADAEADRQRTLLAREYASAIQKAQSDNDLARAQALYEEAKRADTQLLARRRGDSGGKYSGAANNGGLDSGLVVTMQKDLGVPTDGKWGPETREAADKKWGTIDPATAWKIYSGSPRDDNPPSYQQRKNYGEVVTEYIRLKEEGTSQAALNDALNQCVAKGLITQAQADDIRNQY